MGSSALLADDLGFICAASGGSWVHLRCKRRVLCSSALLAEDHGFICAVIGESWVNLRY